jgi:hypothetical protein
MIGFWPLDVGAKDVFGLAHFSLQVLQHTIVASEGVLSTSSAVKQITNLTHCREGKSVHNDAQGLPPYRNCGELSARVLTEKSD